MSAYGGIRTLTRLGRSSQQVSAARTRKRQSTSLPRNSIVNGNSTTAPSIIRKQQRQALVTMPALTANEEHSHVQPLVIEDEALILLETLKNMPQVRIGDPAVVEAKLRRFIGCGKDRMMVVSDFDYTMSRFVDESGERCWTTHGVFDNFAHTINPELEGKFNDLKNKYFPIEFCPDLPVEEKIPHMETWWSTSHGHILSAGFKRSNIRDFVSGSKIHLRDGCVEWIRRLESLHVPLMVFSAGIGNIIEFFLENTLKTVPPNLHLISNIMQFDQNDRVKSFSEPMIHTFCKNTSVISHDAPFFTEIIHRPNMLLLGDSMGDVHMDAGIEKDGPTLKIGFLNSNVEKLLAHYTEIYDIVILEDMSMTVPTLITDTIAASQKQ